VTGLAAARRPIGLRIRRPRLGVLVTSIAVGIVVVIAVVGPYITPYRPTAIGPAGSELLPPSLEHLFGTDQVARDVFSRVLAGARPSLVVAVAVLALAVSFGTALGLLAGLGNRVVDELVMRVTDMFFAFPYMILAMAIVASLGQGEVSLILALAVIWWPSYARYVRGHVLAIKTALFVDASRIVGNTSLATARKHVLPQMFGELGVRVSLDIGNVVLIASALGFLGLGARPPSPEWGAVLFEARSYALSAPWVAIFPGLAITLTILSFSLFGDAISSNRVRLPGQR
jgi:peptide/nickel transport system permease protein